LCAVQFEIQFNEATESFADLVQIILQNADHTLNKQFSKDKGTVLISIRLVHRLIGKQKASKSV